MSRFQLAISLFVLVAGCQQRDPPKVAAGDVERKLAEAAATTADYARQEKDECVSRARKAVEEGRAEIDRLEAEAGTARVDAKRRLERRIGDLEARWSVAERRLRELESASGEAWRDLRSGVDKAVQDLKRSAPSRQAG